MDRKTIIYLANPCNTKFGCSPSTVPLEIGYIKAYAMSQLSDEVDIQLHRTFESLYEAIQTKEPDIVGCSWYDWNRWLSINALTYIKSRHPNVITIVGGPNVPEKPEDCLVYFKRFPCIDIMIPREGEIPFVNLLKVFIQGGKEAVFKAVIDGIFYLSDSQEVVSGGFLPLIDDISIFPSPYLNGYLDEFLNSELMPLLQATRGCPFSCSFCISGKDSWNRIRAFDRERVKKEIDYLEANAKNRTIRFTDDNFGIVPADLEIAHFIAQKRKKSGYPSGIRLYTHKRIDSRTKEITLLLKDLIPMNISYQSLSEASLKNIRRKNIGLNDLRDAVKWAHKNSINVTTELIFGLPGETYESFMDAIDRFVELRLDSIALGAFQMYKEIDLNRPDEIKKHGYEILYSIAERGYTKASQFENIEVDAFVTKSNTFTFEDYTRMKLFMMIFDLIMFYGYFKEMVYILDNRDVKLTDVISEFLDIPEAYPFFSLQIERLRKCFKDNLFESEEDVHRVFSERFSENNDSGQYIGFMSPFILSKIIHGEMIHSSNQEKMIDEVIKAATAVFKRCGKGELSEFLKEMQFAKILAQNVIIAFWEKPRETVILSSPYDLIAWRKQDFRGTLSSFILHKPVRYQFKVCAISQYNNFIRENSNKPFYLQSEFFFRAFRSNNIRRFIVTDERPVHESIID